MGDYGDIREHPVVGRVKTDLRDQLCQPEEHERRIVEYIAKRACASAFLEYPWLRQVYRFFLFYIHIYNKAILNRCDDTPIILQPGTNVYSLLFRHHLNSRNLEPGRLQGDWANPLNLYSLSDTSLSQPAGFSSPYSSDCRPGAANP